MFQWNKKNHTAFPILEMMHIWEIKQLDVAGENGVDAP